LSKVVDISDEWIRTGTGIRDTRITASDQITSDFCAFAARKVIANVRIGVKHIDLILTGTTTPDVIFSHISDQKTTIALALLWPV
jgi:3-oxoacyl-[acyl-carrier-protein] synthase III